MAKKPVKKATKKKPEFKLTVRPMVEVDADFLFENESENWKWCLDNATFTHREACEFIIHLGKDTIFEPSFKKYGCSKEFSRLIAQARAAGAEWLLLYA